LRRQLVKTKTLNNKNSEMKKSILPIFLMIFSIIALIAISIVASAQTNASSTAQQTVELGLSNTIDITFTGSGTATGGTVTLPFATVTDYANGVESAAQQLKVRSNKIFNVTVAASAANFSVTNNGVTTVSTMPVAGVLDLMVSSNQAGGTIASGYSAYGGGLSTAAASILTGASNGNNQTFSVKYKATPGFAYPSGVYAVDVIYTATQQ
jgi:hypothetical protein